MFCDPFSKNTWLQIESVQQVLQHVLLDAQTCDSFARRWQLKTSAVQAFVEYANPRPVRVQNFERFSTTTKKHKQRSAACIASDMFPNHIAQPVKPPTQIDR